MRLRVFACVCLRLRAFASACVRVHPFASVCVCVRPFVSAHWRARVCLRVVNERTRGCRKKKTSEVKELV